MGSAASTIVWEITRPDDLAEVTARLKSQAGGRPAGADIRQTLHDISRFADLWRPSESIWRTRAGRIPGPFTLRGVEPTLHALLDSLPSERRPTPNWAERLINDRMAGRCGYPLVGHIAASNTPLLAWTSVLRALLTESASIVKLPSEQPAISAWARLFRDSMMAASPRLAECMAFVRWKGGARTDLDVALCETSDLVLAYGSDQTIAAIRGHCAGKPFLGYGHRVSLAVIVSDADFAEAASKLALDILLYDQSGCLSPHTVFVEGGVGDVGIVSRSLANALRVQSQDVPAPVNDERRRAAVAEARSIAKMGGLTLHEGDNGRWTVVQRAAPQFTLSPTHGVVYVAPVAKLTDLGPLLSGLDGLVQGCAVAGPVAGAVRQMLRSVGVSYICEPGRLQCPPIDWPEDGLDPFASIYMSATPDPVCF